MTSARSNGSSPHPASAHRLPDFDELESPPLNHRLGNGASRVAISGSHPTPEDWMRSRFPEVFRDFTGDIFERTQKKNRICRLGPHSLFARCLGPNGTPDEPLVYCPGARGLGGQGYYRYDPDTGIYRQLTRDAARTVVDELLDRCAENSDGGKQVHRLRKNRKCDEVLTALKGEATVPLEEFRPDARRRHVANGILDLEMLTLDDWSPEERSLSRLPVEWQRQPAFPGRFVSWMRDMFPEPDDRDLLLSVMALALLGNPLQKLVILTGEGGTGKSTLVKLMAALVGHEASGQLRLDQLDYQFEPRRWFDKLLLYADEADGTIEKRAARQLKRLTGQSEYVAEFKNSNSTLRFRPRTLPVLVSNGRIRVETNDDQEAWSRRLVVLEAASAGASDEELEDFEQVHLEEEGSGILGLVAERARQVLRWRDAGRRIQLQNPRQRGRASRVLLGFDPIRVFVRERLEYCQGAKTYKGEVYEDACQWLRDRGHQVPHTQTLAKQFAPLMRELGATVDNNLDEHPEYSARGWTHVRLAR